MLERLLFESLTVYIVAMVIVKGSIFEKPRNFIRKHTSFLQVASHPHFIDCRLCVSFWVSVIVVLITRQYADILPAYGLAYFLATQER